MVEGMVHHRVFPHHRAAHTEIIHTDTTTSTTADAIHISNAMPLVAPLVVRVAVAHRPTISISFHHNAMMAMLTTTGGVTTIAAEEDHTTTIAAAVDHRTIGIMAEQEEEAVGTTCIIEEICTETVVDEIETETTIGATTTIVT